MGYITAVSPSTASSIVRFISNSNVQQLTAFPHQSDSSEGGLDQTEHTAICHAMSGINYNGECVALSGANSWGHLHLMPLFFQNMIKKVLQIAYLIEIMCIHCLNWTF